MSRLTDEQVAVSLKAASRGKIDYNTTDALLQVSAAHAALQEKARAVLAARSCCDPACCKASVEHTKALEEMRSLLPEEGR